MFFTALDPQAVAKSSSRSYLVGVIVASSVVVLFIIVLIAVVCLLVRRQKTGDMTVTSSDQTRGSSSSTSSASSHRVLIDGGHARYDNGKNPCSPSSNASTNCSSGRELISPYSTGSLVNPLLDGGRCKPSHPVYRYNSEQALVSSIGEHNV